MTQNPKETTEAAAVEPHNLRLSRVSWKINTPEKMLLNPILPVIKESRF